MGLCYIENKGFPGVPPGGRISMDTIEIVTSKPREFLEVTGRITARLAANGWRDGVLHLFVPHTTAGLFVNEHADPDVARDIESLAGELVSDRFPYRHAEGNSPGHVKSVLFGISLALIVEDGRLVLGTWQGVFFAEFDGPRRRKLFLKFMKS